MRRRLVCLMSFVLVALHASFADAELVFFQRAAACP